MSKRTRLALVMSCLAVGAAGCEDVEWNWDATWWKQPRRTVRPAPRRPTTVPARVADRSDPRGPREPEPPSVPPAPTPSAEAPTAAAPVGQRPALVRPYRYLYLTSAETTGRVTEGDARLNVKHVDAMSCATLLEMLYVPAGRSGSRHDCYLLFEDADEFAAAVRFAPQLDVPPARTAPSNVVGPDAAFVAGIALFHGILARRPAVEPAILRDCERFLTDAAQSMQVPAPQRWAAAVLAGRLAADYCYDYPTARSYFHQASEHASAGSLEQLTALWWLQDALTHEGDRDQARRVTEAILTAFGDRKDSQIVRRAQALRELWKN